MLGKRERKADKVRHQSLMDHNLPPQPGIARPVPLRVDYDELAVLLPEPSLDDGLYHVVIDRRVRQLEFLFRVR